MPSLFSFPDDNPSPKLHISSGHLPPYVDPRQPPTKRSPWRQIRNVPFGQSMTAILPEELYDVIGQKIEAEMAKVRYANVFMKLQDLLEGDFFTRYIKRGNVLMLSEGKPGVENAFSLREGVLRMLLKKEDYERAGLQGKPARSGGRKHVRSWYSVEIDLRQPSMLHGKKGFERIVWAAKNVLNQSLMWLFSDLEAGRMCYCEFDMHVDVWLTRLVAVAEDDTISRPIESHAPTRCAIVPEIISLNDVLVPLAVSSSLSLSETQPRIAEQETIYEVAEWIDLITLGSPRISATSNVDPYISRYAPPEETSSGNLKVLKFEGMFGAEWVMQFLIVLIRQSRVSQAHWLALAVSAHDTDAVGQIDGYTLILHRKDETSPPESVLDSAGEKEQSDANNPKHLEGLRRYTCLEFVDSTT